MAVRGFRTSRERNIRLSMTHAVRRAQRERLTDGKRQGLERATPEQRWAYFLNETCGQEEVWLPIAPDGDVGGWCDIELSRDILPMWPHAELAADFLTSKSEIWRIVPVPITDCIDEILPKIEQVDYLVAAFPLSGKEFTLLEPITLADEWENHWAAFIKSQSEGDTEC